jgi:hypothetical protein
MKMAIVGGNNYLNKLLTNYFAKDNRSSIHINAHLFP